MFVSSQEHNFKLLAHTRFELILSQLDKEVQSHAS